ncbi:hypothetical protein PVA19_04155 [Agrobacterium sp. CNPSo 3708]|uniref:hypothetical protein n=1 Tax=Agrobacterium sp. CNPSo 3708 TaxID=3028150 RepID=UPI0023635915|nr:hypothetical protein [Agrobacterium sp. CNPSo 3708]MDD1497594.1 hypothetical protein [Agrobacterium sp. CNPSo 3708]
MLVGKRRISSAGPFLRMPVPRAAQMPGRTSLSLGYADNGDYIDAPLSINRKEGTVYVQKDLVTKGRVYVGSAGSFLETDGNVAFTGGTASLFGPNLGHALDQRLLKSGGTMTGTLGLPSVSDSSFRQGNADAASYTSHNLVMKGWWGMGMATYDNSVNGYYDFRLGKWDTKGGTFKNGTEYVSPNGQMHNISINLSAGQLRDAGSPTGRAMTFNWNGQSGTPDWLWGGYDGTNMYVFSPSNISVKNAAQLGGLPASAYKQNSIFQSGNQDYVTNSVRSVDHGLGTKPNFYAAELVCTVANNGWAVGDTIDLASAAQPWSGQGHFGLLYWATPITINWKVAVNGILILDKNGGGNVVAPSANWALRFRAGF